MSSGARPRVSVVLFPGSNCDHDAVHAVETVIGADARLVWHDGTDLGRPDRVVPGVRFGPARNGAHDDRGGPRPAARPRRNA